MSAELENLVERLEAVEERLGGLARKTRGDKEDMVTRLTSLEKNSGDDLKDRIQTLEFSTSDLSDLKTKVQGLEAAAEAKPEPAPEPQASGTMEQLEDMVRVLEDRVQQQDLESMDYQGRIEELQVRIAQLEEEASRIQKLLSPIDIELLAQKVASEATAPVMRAIDAKLKKLSKEVVADAMVENASEQIVEIASERVLQLVDEKVASLGEGSPVAAVSAEGYDHELFVKLVKEVKAIREEGSAGSAVALFNSAEFKELFDAKLKHIADFLRKEIASGEGTPQAESVNLLNTTEFKEFFDAKLKPIVDYLKSDVIPKAVQDAAEAAKT